MHQRKRLLAQLNMDITCSLDKHGLKIIRKIKKNRKNPSPAIMAESGCASMDYPSISMFSPDLSSTVKWSSQTMIR